MKKYIYNMDELLASADVVICRAGAMTLTEVALLGKASVIIPSPYVTDNHQYKNAKVLSDKNAAVLLEEKELSGNTLVQNVRQLTENKPRRKEMEKNVKEFAVYDSLDRIYETISGLVK